MERRTGGTRNRQTKLLKVGATSTAFFFPIIVAAAYLNMGQTCSCGRTCLPPDFRVSITSDGVAADDSSIDGSVSGQGYDIAFSSVATNLDPAASSAIGPQVYVHNTVTKDTTWVNLSALGYASLGAGSPVLSQTGQYIAFTEQFGTPTSPFYFIFFRDLTVSSQYFETITYGSSPVLDPTMSADGRYVAFATDAALLPEDTDALSDIYLKDRQTTALTLLSDNGVGANDAVRPRLSGDGQWITFDLEPGAPFPGLIVTDVAGIELWAGLAGDLPSISDDGSVVAFRRWQSGGYKIFIDGLLTGPTEEVSLDTLGNPSTDDCDYPVLSGNGRYVAFSCVAPMTDHGATNQVYVRDLINQTTKLASISESGVPANSADSKPVSITTNGNIVIIESSATNLGNVPGGFPQLFRVTSSYWSEGGTTCSTNDTTCDGVDDDCDGQTDEDYVSQPTSCGIGACIATGTRNCQGGATVNTCVPFSAAADDAICDGIDEDCDGPLDEDYVTQPSSCGFGPCAATGFATCVAGQIIDSCTPGTPPASDDSLCDGIDNDCDGPIDEDCVTCIPATCQEYNINCGTVDDGCGGTIDCGGCQSPETCGGGGFANVCGVPLPPDPVDVAPMVEVGTGTMVQSFGFLTEGPTPIQTGVEEGAIEPQRAAIVRGQVQTHNGDPLPGVTVKVKRDASLGQTVSRSDGRYDLLINGGGSLTLEYTAVGYLPIQRTVRVPWSGFAELESVAMIVQSDVATDLVFDANSVDPQIAVSRSVDDGEGQRQVVGFLPAGLQATAEIDGLTVPISNGTIRMTEYTVGSAGPKAMPGVLPDNSLYTFAVDISLDEVGPTAPVTFDKTTFFYLDNFLNLPVGAVVPNGRYDYETSRWVAERDGLVMKVVGVVDGLAEIDATDGDTDPEDQAALDELRMSADERREIALRYPVESTFWRMPIDHLSAYDWNFAGVRGDPPPGAPPPPDGSAEPGTNDGSCGSIIHCQSRTLSEEIPIAGTPYYLRYDSDRAAANVAAGRTALIPLPENPPSGATDVRIQASVLGREVLNETLSLPLTESTRTVVWDGLDTYGRPWVGSAELEYSISYAFGGVYQLAMARVLPPWEARSFGVPVCDLANDPCCVRTSGGGGDGFSLTSASGRSFTESNLSYEGTLPLGNAGAAPYRLGGWSLSHYHIYDQPSGKLHLGTGQTRDVTPPGDVAAAYITGSAEGFVDGYKVYSPSPIAVGPDGNVYFAGLVTSVFDRRVVWRVDPDGALGLLFVVDEQDCELIEDLAVDSQGVLHYLCSRTPSGPAVYRAVEETSGEWTHQVVIDGASVDDGPAWTDGEPLDGSFFRANTLFFRDDGTLFFVLREWPDVPQSDVRHLVEYLPNGRGAVVASSEQIEFASSGPNNTIVASYRIDDNPFGLAGIAQLFPDGSSTILATPAGTQGREEAGFEWKSTETHGPRAGFDGIAASEDGDVFVTTYGGSNNNNVYQISRGAIRRISLSALRIPNYSLDRKKPRALAAAPNGSVYMVDSTRDAIYALEGGGFAREVASSDGSEIYGFSAAGLHESTRNASTGDVLFSFVHDSDGNLSEIVDQNGHVTRFDRPDSSSIVITAPPGPAAATGVQTTLQLSSSTGHLELVTDPRQGKWFFEYASGGLLERLWNPRANLQGLQSGNPFVFAYEQFKSTAATQPDANARWLLESDDDPVGGSQTLTLDHARELTPIYGTWCNGDQYVRGYDVQSVTSEVTRTTAEQRVTRYTTTTSSDAPVTTTRSDPTGWYVTRTDPGGEMTASASWPGGSSNTAYTSHPTLGDTVRVPASSTTSYASVGNHGPLQLDATYVHDSTFPSVLGGFPTPDTEIVTKTLTPIGVGGSPREYVSVYDGQARTFTVTSPEGRSYLYVLDQKSRLTERHLPGQVPTVFDYFLDDTGTDGYLHTASRDRGGDIRQMTLGYDTRGDVNSLRNKVSDTVTDEITMVNDTIGFATQTTVPGLLTVVSSPDLAGTLSSLTPDGKPTHQLSYTPLGQLQQYASPAGALSTDGSCPSGTQCWRYSVDRELDDITLPDGTIVDYVYDPVKGTLTSIEVPGHGTTTLQYDSVGRRDSATAPTGGTMGFGWQSTLPISTSWSGGHTVPGVPGTVSLNGTVERFYNDFLEVSEIHVSGGAKVKLMRDDDGLVTDIVDVDGVLPTMTLNRSTIDGHIDGTTFGTVTTIHTLDISETTPGFGDLLSVSADAGATSLYDASYTYDDRGRIKTWTENFESGASVTRSFDYDAAGRLFTVHDISGGLPGTLLEEYLYDGNGNREKAVSNYPGATPLNAELGTNLGCPDASGTAANDEDQLCQYGDSDSVYNARGQLESRSTGGATTQYAYDGLGRLKQVTEPGMDIHYVHDALGRRMGKIRDGNLEKGWLYADALNPIAQLDSDGNIQATFVYGSRAHVPDAMVMTDGTVYRFITDHLGSVRLAVNAETGTVVQRMDYDAFGRVLQDTNPGFQPFGFAGGIYDDDTGLVRFGVRDYDAYAGRWTAKDPLLFGGRQANLYAYVGDDPINRTDPSGLAWYDWFFDTDVTDGSARRAAERAAANSGLPGPHNGPQDAFRHCVWQCEATRQAGPFDAWLAGTGHEWEQGGGQERDEFNSDLENNRCGREGAKRWGSCTSNCTNMLISGELNVLDSDGNPGYQYR